MRTDLVGVAPLALDELAQRFLAGVAERGVTDVVAQADRLGEGLVEAEAVGDRPTDLGDLEGVGQSGDVVVTLRVHEDLRLVLQAPECLGVEDPVTVALEGGPPWIGFLGNGTSKRLGRERRSGASNSVSCSSVTRRSRRRNAPIPRRSAHAVVS